MALRDLNKNPAEQRSRFKIRRFSRVFLYGACFFKRKDRRFSIANRVASRNCKIRRNAQKVFFCANFRVIANDPFFFVIKGLTRYGQMSIFRVVDDVSRSEAGADT